MRTKNRIEFYGVSESTYFEKCPLSVFTSLNFTFDCITQQTFRVAWFTEFVEPQP
jgi:hypothetical protein